MFAVITSRRRKPRFCRVLCVHIAFESYCVVHALRRDNLLKLSLEGRMSGKTAAGRNQDRLVRILVAWLSGYDVGFWLADFSDLRLFYC